MVMTASTIEERDTKKPSRSEGHATLGSSCEAHPSLTEAGTLAVAARLPGTSADLPLAIAPLRLIRTNVLYGCPLHRRFELLVV